MLTGRGQVEDQPDHIRSSTSGRGRFEPAQNTYATFACLSNPCK